MRRRSDIIRRAVIVLGAVTCLLAAPATASAGGIDPTRHCVQDAADTYAYDPYSVKKLLTFYESVRTCQRSFVTHMTDSRKRDAWVRCVEDGLGRSTPPLTWDPFPYAVHSCSESWLELTVRIDPYPR